MTHIVDVHCHTFNGDDVPVRGFVRRTVFHDSRLGGLLGSLADRLIDGAPDYSAENSTLNALLGPNAVSESVGDAARARPDEDFEASVDTAMIVLSAQDPMLITQVGAVMLAEDAVGTGTEGAEGLGDWLAAARRAVRWISMFRARRFENTLMLIQNLRDRVDLFTPMTVDLDFGLHDNSGTTPRQQVELQEKISRLSMLGQLPGVRRARVHPFIGFDPRREVRDRLVGEVEKALDVVRLAVTMYGFVGVKLYPPMGFRPIGNEAHLEMTPDDARAVDEVLLELYGWCEENDVPITAHCSRGVVVHESFAEFPSPTYWRKVLDRFPNLRLNLGHFGGDSPVPDLWTQEIAELATQNYPRLYADIGNHRVHDPNTRDAYFAMLKALFLGSATACMSKRLMFGSDWYMVAMHPGHESFLEHCQEAAEAHFTASERESFFGGAALRFLGFNDPSSGNSVRLAARYANYGVSPPAWLSGVASSGPADFVAPGML